ncbi:MAG: prolyl oligopeptidase family serine peptidase [Candidatus Riflebacteria bacterium]|nr:prolyl oligopeptidase family serine peptidase [Candidatus Riflebacteria bacterium]
MGKNKLTRLLICLLVFSFSAVINIMAKEGYRNPEKRIVKIVDKPNPPQLSVNPQGKTALLVEYTTQLSLEDLAEPQAKLAGMRILTRYNIPKRSYFVQGLQMLDLKSGTQSPIKLPEGKKFGHPTWSPDGKMFAAALYQKGGSEIWVFDAIKGTSHRISPPRVNSVLLTPFWWSRDSKTLYVPLWPENRGNPPETPLLPEGPEIQETSGSVSQVRTFQDLIQSDHDERLFDFYATAQVYRYNVATGKGTKFGAPGLISNIISSPDGKYSLVKILERPFSRIVTVGRFAHRYELWDINGRHLKTLASLPAGEDIPIEGVSEGMRSPFWQRMQPATLCWVEALDGGDPNRSAEFRDVLKAHEAPFAGNPREVIKLPMRYSGLDQLNKKDMAMIWDYDRDTKWIKARIIDMSRNNIASESHTLFSRNYYDQYNDEGNLIYRTNSDGESLAILEKDKWVYLDGKGATPDGLRPFIRRFNLFTGEKNDILVSGAETFESFVDFADNDLKTIVTAREDAETPSNYYVRCIEKFIAGEPRALTAFEPPAPELANVKKELIKYERNDGVPLSGTLYYPLNYRPGRRYPAIVWAYPREYTDIKTAGQVRSATNRYTRIDGISILFFLLRGYVVLDNATIPVVGDPLTANDTFVEQISAGAKAAVDKLVELGVADRDRIGIAGHSYGAFMVANLLAHTDLFAAGIARSGAYNRTLTPFGFQGERRTYWEASNIYNQMSAFSHADKIKEPILLLHGADDPNPGTFPIQSQRMFGAIKGHGGIARLVILPYESHSYDARESILHTLVEMFDWFDTYVKNRGRTLKRTVEEKSPAHVD